MEPRKYFSVSSLSLYEKCPKCYALKYIAGIVSPTCNEPAHFGKAVHAGLAAFYQGHKSPRDVFYAELKRDFDKVVDNRGAAPNFDDEAREGNTILQIYPHKCWHFGEPTAVEAEYTVELKHPVTGESLPLPINAHLDLETSAGLVVDHKVVSSPLQGIVGRYRRQMSAYWMVYEAVNGKEPVGFAFNQVLRRKGVPRILQPLRGVVTLDDKIAFWSEAKMMLEAIERKEFDRNETLPYSWHEYQTLCK
jgi:hypothetical protein